MKNVKYLLMGVIFGFALIKGEAVSWYRIIEMFHFQSFHMYGIFLTAIPTGALSLWLIRRTRVKALTGTAIEKPEKKYHHGIIIGGLLFGVGWALTGACPGPLYVLMGSGYAVILVVFVAALIGTWVYAWFQVRLPD